MNIFSSSTASLKSQTFYFRHDDITKAKAQSLTLRIPTRRLQTTEFRYFMLQRIPLVITDLNSRLQLSWSPTQLIEDYGKQWCTMEDCEGKARSERVQLEAFLRLFEGSGKIQSTIWKVKV